MVYNIVCNIKYDVMRKNKDVRIALRTDSDLKRRLQNQSKLQGITLSKHLNNILKHF